MAAQITGNVSQSVLICDVNVNRCVAYVAGNTDCTGGVIELGFQLTSVW